jgi:hypothetical protein
MDENTLSSSALTWQSCSRKVMTEITQLSNAINALMSVLNDIWMEHEFWYADSEASLIIEEPWNVF